MVNLEDHSAELDEALTRHSLELVDEFGEDVYAAAPEVVRDFLVLMVENAKATDVPTREFLDNCAQMAVLYAARSRRAA